AVAQIVKTKNSGPQAEREAAGKPDSPPDIRRHEGEGQHAQESAHVLEGGAVAAHDIHHLLRLTFQRGGNKFGRKKPSSPQPRHARQPKGDAHKSVPAPEWMLEKVGDRTDVLGGTCALASSAFGLQPG